MKRMVLVLLLSGFASGQFFRFDDSFEDDSRESPRFGPRPRSFFRRFDDSDEDFGRRGSGRFSFGDSDEDFFRSGKRRNKFDDSDEAFFGTNRNSFVRTSSNRNPFRTLPSFHRNPTFQPKNSFSRPTNFRRPLSVESVEDLFEDLFDEDFDDRFKARNALAALGRTSPTNFRSSVLSRGTTPFKKRVGNNRFRFPTARNSPPKRPFRLQSTQNQNALNHFSTKQRSGSAPSTVNKFRNGFSFGTTIGNTNNRFNGNNRNRGVPLSNTFQSQKQRTSSRHFRSNKGNSASPFNNIRKGSAGASASPFPSPPGFQWPGGNGYFVSMSTGRSKPISYFVRYDD